MSVDKFTRDEEINLIGLVSQNRCIYDASHDNYKNIQIRDNIWKTIATEMEGKSDEMCKKRWRSIRDTHKRLKKQDKGTDSAARKTVKWSLAPHLTFLDNVQEERRSFSNIVEESLENNSDSASECHQAPEEWPVLSPPQSYQTTNSASSSRKRKKSHVDDEDLVQLIKESRKTREQIFDFLVQNKKTEIKEDDVDLFYKSIALSVKRLPPHLISSAKIQHLQILINLETEAANMQQGLEAIQSEVSFKPEAEF